MKLYHRTLSVLSLAAIVCAVAMSVSPSEAADAAKKSEPAIIAKCKADLAQRLSLRAQDMRLVESQATTWPDAALGMPEMGKMYAQVLTPGLRVILEAKSTKYLYTTGGKSFRYGGPTDIWAYSVLSIQATENEPNLNGDLYQCSLLGTNCARLISGVNGFYPQAKGAVIAKRRTSRSGHELVYIKPDSKGKEKVLRSAMDFGEAAFNDAQDKWAGFVKPAMGTDWRVVVARVGAGNAEGQALPLPENVKPGQIAWSGENVMILSKDGERMSAYEISPAAEKPEWKEVQAHTFPGLTDYMLNKSETLEIDQMEEDGKPVVEVARVWFTGDRNVVAKIKGVTLRGYDLLGGYAVIWGEKSSKPVLYTVDISNGEVIPSAGEVGRDMKPFVCPPHTSPLELGKAK